MVHQEAGAIAEVALIEVQLAQSLVGRRIVLDRLVKGDRADVGLTVRVVQAPVVGVVDDLVALDLLRLEPGVIGDETQHTASIVFPGALTAGEVLRVHLEDARDIDLLFVGRDAAVPFATEKGLGRRVERAFEPIAAIGPGRHGRAAVGSAVDGKVDARGRRRLRVEPCARCRRGSPLRRRRCGGGVGRTGRRASSTPTGSGTPRQSRPG